MEHTATVLPDLKETVPSKSFTAATVVTEKWMIQCAPVASSVGISPLVTHFPAAATKKTSKMLDATGDGGGTIRTHSNHPPLLPPQFSVAAEEKRDKKRRIDEDDVPGRAHGSATPSQKVLLEEKQTASQRQKTSPEDSGSAGCKKRKRPGGEGVCNNIPHTTDGGGAVPTEGGCHMATIDRGTHHCRSVEPERTSRLKAQAEKKRRLRKFQTERESREEKMARLNRQAEQQRRRRKKIHEAESPLERKRRLELEAKQKYRRRQKKKDIEKMAT